VRLPVRLPQVVLPLGLWTEPPAAEVFHIYCLTVDRAVPVLPNPPVLLYTISIALSVIATTTSLPLPLPLQPLHLGEDEVALVLPRLH